MSDQEYSASGDPIHRHNRADKQEPDHATGNERNIEAISTHIEKHIGPVDYVFHEIVSDLVHLDIHFVKPSEELPYNVLVTSGMSDRAMNVPEEMGDFKYTELCMLLPADWPLGQEAFKDENNYWPVRWLKTIARLPHQHNSWIGNGHTIPNGEEATPFARNTNMGCLLVMPGLSLSSEFKTLKTSSGKTIYFYCVYPLYKAEMEHKLKHGLSDLLHRMDDLGVLSDVLNVKRECSCGRMDED